MITIYDKYKGKIQIQGFCGFDVKKCYIHREDGPAIIWDKEHPYPTEEYFLDNEIIPTKKLYEQEIMRRKLSEL